MKRAISGWVLFLTALVWMACATLTAVAQGEHRIKPRELPSAVAAAFHKSYPNAKIVGTSGETEEGKTLYEVESVDGTIKRDLLYAPDGSCVEVEESMPAKALPSGLLESLKKSFPKGRVMKAEKLTKGASIQYELTIKNGREQHEVVFDTNWTLVKDTQKDPKIKGEKEGEEQNEKD
jgi:hypothetical protein